MRAYITLLYGLLAYVAAMATLSYYVGFSANLWVPKSVDSGTAAPWPQALATDLLLLALFGLQHSVMARRGFKRWWTRLVPEAAERSTFLVAACAALGMLFWGWVPITAPVVWQVQQPAAVALLWGLFWLGVVLAVLSTYLIDHFALFGLRQVFDAWRGASAAQPGFVTPLLYRHVRHPLYVGFLLGLWSVPVMTAGRLLFAAGLTAYILIGIAFEERDLVAQFGERYRAYRRAVGMLLPRLSARRAGRTEG